MAAAIPPTSRKRALRCDARWRELGMVGIIGWMWLLAAGRGVPRPLDVEGM
jgi:hypothetical protein